MLHKDLPLLAAEETRRNTVAAPNSSHCISCCLGATTATGTWPSTHPPEPARPAHGRHIIPGRFQGCTHARTPATLDRICSPHTRTILLIHTMFMRCCFARQPNQQLPRPDQAKQDRTTGGEIVRACVRACRGGWMWLAAARLFMYVSMYVCMYVCWDAN